MKIMSVKTYATPFADSLVVEETTAFDIIAAMEERFMDQRPMITPITPLPLDTPLAARVTRSLLRASLDKLVLTNTVNDEALTIRAKRMQRKLLRKNFGPKPEWLPKDELRIIDQSKEGLEGWEDRLAAACYAVEKIKSRQAWKLEQSEPQEVAHYSDLTLSYELPPRTTRKSHQPAYYSITGPSGVTIDLGKPQGGYKPILCKNPNEAFRRFIARLGVTMKGGEVEILNKLLKANQVECVDAQGNVSKEWKWLPSYTTTLAPYDNWIQNIWFVKVGWRLNPKVAPSRYWLDADGELTQDDPNAGLAQGDEGYEAPLTLSQLDYHLLCDSKDLAVQDEDGNVIDYMNEDEEFLSMFGDREESETFIDLDQFVAGEGDGDYDDDELRLIKECSFNVDRSESGITMGDLQSQQFIRHLDEQIREAEQELEMVECFGEDAPEATAAAKRLARANRLDYNRDRFATTSHDSELVHYWYPTTNRMMTMGLDVDFMREPVKTIEGASLVPTNDVDRPITHQCDYMRPTRGFTLSLDDAKRIRRQKAVCQSIIHNRFGMLVREKAASEAFANALTKMLA